MYKSETIKTFESIEEEKALNEFKLSRQVLLESLVVTTTSGKKFNGDEKSQGRMNNAIAACSILGMTDESTLSWSLADTPSGEATGITVAELKEAYVRSVENMAAIWLR